MLTFLTVVLVVAAIAIYIAIFSGDVCPSCGTELGISYGGARATVDSCYRCGWRRRST